MTPLQRQREVLVQEIDIHMHRASEAAGGGDFESAFMHTDIAHALKDILVGVDREIVDELWKRAVIVHETPPSWWRRFLGTFLGRSNEW